MAQTRRGKMGHQVRPAQHTLENTIPINDHEPANTMVAKLFHGGIERLIKIDRYYVFAHQIADRHPPQVGLVLRDCKSDVAIR